jgi:hypothetical protein
MSLHKLLDITSQASTLKVAAVRDKLEKPSLVSFMQGSFHLNAGTSRIWLTPDLAFGFHCFNYSNAQYEGLAHTHTA